MGVRHGWAAGGRTNRAESKTGRNDLHGQTWKAAIDGMKPFEI